MKKLLLCLSCLMPLYSHSEPDSDYETTEVEDPVDSAFDSGFKKPEVTKAKKPTKKAMDLLSFRGTKKGDACLCRCACPNCAEKSADASKVLNPFTR